MSLPKQSSLLKQSAKLDVFFPNAREAASTAVIMDLNCKQIRG